MVAAAAARVAVEPAAAGVVCANGEYANGARAAGARAELEGWAEVEAVAERTAAVAAEGAYAGYANEEYVNA